MKNSKMKFKPMNQQSSSTNLAATMIITAVVLLATLGALNGGVAVTTGVWDDLVSTLKDLLTSSWVIALAFVALVAAVWQIAHGRGYTTLATILGLLAVALIGPDMSIAISTTTHSPISAQPALNSQLGCDVCSQHPLLLHAAR